MRLERHRHSVPSAWVLLVHANGSREVLHQGETQAESRDELIGGAVSALERLEDASLILGRSPTSIRKPSPTPIGSAARVVAASALLPRPARSEQRKVGGAPGTRTRSQRLKRPLLYH